MVTSARIAALSAVLFGMALLSGSAHAEPLDGSWSRANIVQAYSRHTYTEDFYVGKASMIIVSGDGDTDLDLYVFDRFGNLVASDTDLTDQCVVAFVPSWPGRYRIVIRNRGPVYNRYMISVL
jgi:hypothetical protein